VLCFSYTLPKDAHLVLVQEPLDVWIEGERRTTYFSGKVLIVDPLAKPAGDQEIELVVASRDPDFDAKPTKDDPEPARGRSQLMRYEKGPRGVQILFPLDGSEAETSKGWRIVGVVTDERLAQRRSE